MTYLLYRVHSFTCDHPGCQAEEEHAEPTKDLAVKIMRRQGWLIGRELDFCPEHVRPAPGAAAKEPRP